MKKAYPKVLVFASGGPNWEEGGSGFEKMVEAMRKIPPILRAFICAVVSNHSAGGVAEKAERLGIRFRHWKGPFTAEGYQQLVKYFNPDYMMLSGWLKLVAGLDMARTINIHPGPLPRFGGPNLYGHYVHEAVMAAYHRGEITHSAVTMHFVDEVYDRGPVFFQYPIGIEPNDTPETLKDKVNQAEHAWQSLVLNFVVQGQVRLVNGVVEYESDELRNRLMGKVN